jgi:hypothetical protein
VVGTREDVLLDGHVGLAGARSLCVDAEWVNSC